MLIDAGVLQQALLVLSLFFRQHRSRYYVLLAGIREDGDWEAWIDFFLEGVENTATAAVTTAHRLLALFRADEARLSGLGRSGPGVSKVFAALRRRPLNSIKQLSSVCSLSFPTAAKALEALVDLGIAREITGGQRNRLFAYDAYLAILSEGAEPL
jgi:Fic family protein